jgi:hypothetical protein
VDRAAEEGTVLPDARDDVRVLLDHLLGGIPVRLTSPGARVTVTTGR